MQNRFKNLVKTNSYFKTRLLIALLSMGLLFNYSQSFAEDDTLSAPAGQSSVSVPSNPLKNIAISYWGMYQGPALTHPTRGGAIDTTSLQYSDGEQNLYNQFKFDYKFNENIFVGPVVNFQLNPTAGGSAFVMKDTGVRVGDKHVIHTDNLDVYADFRVMAPTDPSNIKNDEIIDLQTLDNITYKIPKSNWTLGLLMFHNVTPYGSGRPYHDPSADDAPHDIALYFGPNVGYQITPTLAATMYYEMYPLHHAGAAFWTWAATPADLAPGLSWDITPSLNLSPQIVMYPSKLNVNNMGTVAYLSAKFL